MRIEKLNPITEGVRMTPSAFKANIDPSKVKIGFEIEFLLSQKYADYYEKQRQAALDKYGYSEDRSEMTKDEFIALMPVINRTFLAVKLAQFFMDKVQDISTGIERAVGEANKIAEGCGLTTPEAIVTRMMAILDEDNLNSSRFDGALMRNNYGGADGPERFREHLLYALKGTINTELSDDQNDDFSSALYAIIPNSMFMKYNFDAMTPDLFEDFIFTLRDDEDFERIIISRTDAASNNFVAKFLREKAKIKIKSVSAKYGGAKRDFEGDTTGYYLEQDGAGPELVSDPMPLTRGLEELENILSVISEYFQTDASRGLHINVSIDGLTTYNIDLMKLMLFLGEDYLLNSFGRMDNDYTKPQSYNISRYFSMFRTPKENFDRVFVQPEYVSLANAAMTDFLTTTGANSNAKYHTFNPLKLYENKPYLEFRIMGNEGYERRFQEIRNQIQRYVYVMSLAMDPEAERKEYAKKLWRLTRDFKANNIRPSDFTDFMKTARADEMAYTYTVNDRKDTKQFKLFTNGYEPIDWNGPFFKALSRLSEYGVGSKQFNTQSDGTLLLLGGALIYMAQRKMFNVKQRSILRMLVRDLKTAGVEPVYTTLESSLRFYMDELILNGWSRKDGDRMVTFGGQSYHDPESFFRAVEDTVKKLYTKL